MHTAIDIAAQDQTCIFNVNSEIIIDRMRLYENNSLLKYRTVVNVCPIMKCPTNENGLKWTKMDSFVSNPDSDLLNSFLSN